MSVDTWVLHDMLPAYYGFFTELNPKRYPITTIVGAKGVRTLTNKEYNLTYHENADSTSGNVKADNSVPTLGSTGFTLGSNTVQVFDEGYAQTYARRGDQQLGQTIGYNNPSNASVEPDARARGAADALHRIKSQLEWQAREGTYEIPSSGTTGVWSQLGYRYARGIEVGTATGAVAGTGTLGTLGTLSYSATLDTIQNIWDKKLMTNGILAVCNSTVKRQLTAIMKSEYDFGKNGALIDVQGVNLERWVTDFGNVDILLTHNFPQNDLYFLNLEYMEMLARPVPGLGFLFEEELAKTSAADTHRIYAEMGMNWQTGSAHGRIFGIGSTVSGGLAVS